MKPSIDTALQWRMRTALHALRDSVKKKLPSVGMVVILAFFAPLSEVRAALPSGTDGNRILTLSHPAACTGCPNWEVSFFEDGSSMFVGKDAVRFLGVNGTHSNAQPKASRSSLMQVRAVLIPIKQKLIAAKAHYGSLRSMVDRLNVAGAGDGESYELSMPFPSGEEQTGLFHIDQSKATELSEIVERIKSAYFSPVDWDREPPFYADSLAILYWSQLWPRSKNLACSPWAPEIVVIAYSDGTVKLSGRAYADGAQSSRRIDTSFNIGADEIEFIRQSITTEAEAIRKVLAQAKKYKRPEGNTLPELARVPRWKALVRLSDNGEILETSEVPLAFGLTQQQQPKGFVKFNELTKRAIAMLGDPPPGIDTCHRVNDLR